MFNLPESEQEFLLWQFEKQDYLTPNSQDELEHVWQWLLRNHERFADRLQYILETDAGLGYQTHVYMFDEVCLFYVSDAFDTFSIKEGYYTFESLEKITGKPIDCDNRLI